MAWFLTGVGAGSLQGSLVAGAGGDVLETIFEGREMEVFRSPFRSKLE